MSDADPRPWWQRLVWQRYGSQTARSALLMGVVLMGFGLWRWLSSTPHRPYAFVLGAVLGLYLIAWALLDSTIYGWTGRRKESPRGSLTEHDHDSP